MSTSVSSRLLLFKVMCDNQHIHLASEMLFKRGIHKMACKVEPFLGYSDKRCIMGVIYAKGNTNGKV